jgi:group II intron reverse transcriptase/maturase
VCQQASLNRLEPIFEPIFDDANFGYRSGRSTKDALKKIWRELDAGNEWVVDADLRDFFDTIPHAELMAVVAERIADGGALALIRQWLKAPVIEEDKRGTTRPSGGRGNRKGTPQGGVISPLLANLYRHLLDRIWERHDLEGRLGARLVRYADDAVILCRGDPAPATAVLESVLQRLELTLNRDKTRVVDAREQAFDFLGFSIKWARSRRTGRGYPNVEPRRRAEERITARVKELTARRRAPVPMPRLIAEVNEVLRGWSGYFHYGHCTKVFGRVRWFTEERIRTQLRERHKVRTRWRGWQRFPHAYIYDRLGLFKLPSIAGWRSAHASA